MVWDKLKAWGDSALQRQLALVSPDTRFVWDEVAPTFWVSTKLRAIDPHVLANGHCQPLSALDTDFSRRRAEYLRDKAGKWPMRVVDAS